ncbi:ABC transporter permease [Fusobacterium necrophorum]|uniref:Glutathione transporter permease gsiD n=1 Tax=Fusobacterium necrophorum DJ-2 TaxID=1441737 RepID=A0AB73C480_9FUSO|nr:ABC transporter permease [Fusobacterium necrophorum]KDE65845.1 glutathione transporter permease gsiD [Fusobacterium necrophorum DJ-1]KDE66703.1 glutathione transporter permease gsiD [Fusobacterium necrophorum BFTR-1]KDE72663.1 glutathione transporter permease gsiD [Fusobacterium necrophorum DJ-2]
MKGKKIKYSNIIFFLFFILLCGIIFFPSFFSSIDPNYADVTVTLHGPSGKHWFGCDYLGRDIFTRVIYGMRSSTMLAVIGVSIMLMTGTIIGMFCGYYSNPLSHLFMRIADMMLAFPGTVLSIAIVGVLGPGILNTLLAILIPGWAEFARVARALTIEQRENEYIKTAVLNGNTNFSILFRYILPNIMASLFVYTSSNIGNFILRLAMLSFLGLGLRPPRPELGLILSEAKDFMQIAPFYMFFPGLALFMIVFVFNSLSDFLRDRIERNR